MSHRIGKNNERNRANRKAKEYPVPLNGKMGDVIKDSRGRKYRIGEHGNLIRVNI